MAKRILIVDDEADIVQLVENRLQLSGFETLSALDGQAGLNLARKEKPDLVILDLMLPKLDGFQVCRLLKFDVATAKIPIIIFTARTHPVDEKTAKESGADDYLAKPFDSERLLEKVNRLLGTG
jgi:DNA-binding response OmpR family regulator